MPLESQFSPNRIKGILWGILAGVSYGTNPLFALPLYREGLGVDSVLFYRYGFAALLLGIWLKVRKTSISIPPKEIFPLFFGGMLMACSSLFLFLSYFQMDAGVASTLLFIYPILVAGMMVSFFHEKLSAGIILSMLLALGGVGVLCRNGDGTPLNFIGILLVFLSAFAYAAYIVAVKESRMKQFSPELLTFYGILLGFPLFFVRLNFGTELQLISSPLGWFCAFSLALFPTIISLIATAAAIRHAGPTVTAILGALEPAAAVFFSVLFFGEPLTPRLITGLLLIGSAAILCTASGNSDVKQTPENPALTETSPK